MMANEWNKFEELGYTRVTEIKGVEYYQKTVPIIIQIAGTIIVNGVQIPSTTEILLALTVARDESGYHFCITDNVLKRASFAGPMPADELLGKMKTFEEKFLSPS